MAASSVVLAAILCSLGLLALSSQPVQCFTFNDVTNSATSSRKSVAAFAAAAINSSRHGAPSLPCSNSRGRLALSTTSIGRLQYRHNRHHHHLLSPYNMILHMTRSNKNDESNDNSPFTSSTTKNTIKLFELNDAFEDDGTNVVGTKFFGGNSIKEELYVPEEEERALELQNVKDVEYNRFEDVNSFGDSVAQRVGMVWQTAINQILYKENAAINSGDGGSVGAAWKEDATLQWETPFSQSKNGAGGRSTPLTELANSKSFYNKLDVAILSANTIQTEGNKSVLDVRWEIGLVWPNFWESRALLTGTSMVTVSNDDENNRIVLLKQVDKLDGGNPMDVVGALSSQLSPRFWDIYHIGMTPSAEFSPRYDYSQVLSSASQSSLLSKSNNKGKKKGLLSNYKLSYLPPRLVIEPSLIDTNGREARTAQVLPNHGFTTAIKTMGPNKEEFVPVSPIEVSISKLEGNGGSLIKWSVPVPPEFASNAVLPLPLIEDEVEDEPKEAIMNTNDAVPSKFSSPYTSGRSNNPPPTPPQSLSVNYSLRSSRLVATLPYAGNPQDEEVTQLRRQLYQQVVENDGYTPKLDPVTNRPIFFFWMNGAKACFTRGGGLGMAVYEWRADWSKSNEVGIELEC
ncbi:hypothetical protein ACHAWU_009036 [Discostella pseudostelligera]|uniref:Uncharacterized protein n=1 Tax=Discostella pseudostelligera TaxID=259834 RepID=A0ABD3MIR8_9STRA